MAQVQQTVYVEGLRELARSLREVDKGLARELGSSFKEGGRIVQQKARELVRSQGLVKSGEALRDIRVRSSSFQVSVVENARRDGYFPYPRLRRFWPLVMEPARDQTREEVLAATRQAIDDLTWLKGAREK